MRYFIAAVFASVVLISALSMAADHKPLAPAISANGKVAVPDTKNADPNLKVTEGSGGKSTSPLINDAPVRGDYVMGKSDAPIVMVEYASLTCPHCAHFSNAVLPELEKKYIETGKLRYILRQFPLNEPALKAAMLVECVGEQNQSKYFIFSRVLFDAQAKWAFDGNYMSGLETIATVGGLSRAEFQSCINNTDREMRVLKVKKAATDDLRIPHTPYIFIDGEVYAGERNVAEISQFVDAKLAARKK